MVKRLGIAFAVIAIAAGALMGTASSPRWGEHWDDLRFPATRLLTGASNPPTFAKYADDGASSVGVFALRFDYQAVSGNEEQAWFDAQLPHGWKEGTVVDVHAHLSPSNTNACNFRLCLEYLLGDAEENFQANTTIACSTFASDQVVLKQQLEEIVEIDMAGYKISAIIKGRVFRNSSHGEDTCSSTDLWVHFIDTHYQTIRPGSRQELQQ